MPPSQSLYAVFAFPGGDLLILFGLLLWFVVAPVIQAPSRGHMSTFGSSKNSTSEFRPWTCPPIPTTY